MVVVANTASKEKLAMEVVKLQVTVKNLTEKDPRKQVDNIAGKLRHEIKPSKSNISWHPLISKLSSEKYLTSKLSSSKSKLNCFLLLGTE